MFHPQEVLQKTEEFVCSTMVQNDVAHDEGHVRRVVALAQKIGGAYSEVDVFRIELLAWLHDMNDDKLASDVGERSVSEFLRDCALPEEEICFIIEALPMISYRKHPSLSSDVPLEIRIVQDADRIDAMVALGVARIFSYGGAKNRSLADSLKHFDEKLLLLYDLLNTDEAKRIALPRHQFLQAFYAQYQAEMK